MYLKTINMMAAGLFLITGCGQEQIFTISGKLNGSGRDTLILEEMAEKSIEMRTRIVTDENGSFNYSDTAANPRLLFLHNSLNEYITLMVQGGDKLKISADKGKIDQTLEISGSRQTALVMELNRETLKANKTLDSVSRQYRELKGKGNDPQIDSWAQGEYNNLVKQQRTFARAFIEKNIDEPACLLALSHQVARQSVLNGSTDFDLFEKVDARLYKKYPNSILVLNLHNYVESMKLQQQPAQVKNKVGESGSVVPDISLPDPEGKTQTLYSHRGKIVLLDFWAGWCGPCRRENPNLVAAYAKYHDKGFEIFQVSLDKSKPEWVAAIKQDKLNWIHVSDLKFWSSPVARQFGIESIPANFLLDKEGKVIGSNLRGTALDQELDKLLR